MSTKRALIVAPSYPYPVDGGNRVALHGYRVALEAAGFQEIDFIGFREGQRGGQDFTRSMLVEKPPKLSVSSIIGFVQGKSLLLARYHSDLFVKTLVSLCRERQYEVVLFQHGYMAQYKRYVYAVLPDAKFVASAEVLESRAYKVKAGLQKNLLKKILLAREAELLDRQESAAFDQFGVVTFFSDEDLAHYRQCGGRSEAVQVNLGLDMSKYDPLPMPAVNSPFVVTFFGSFSWFANLDALEYLLKDVWPAVVKRNPAVHLKIAGRDIPSWVSSYASDSVNLLGRVDSIRDLIASSHAVLSPIRIGGGVRLKMLESLAYGRQVISTAVGMEGLEPSLKEQILVANSPDDFAEAIFQLSTLAIQSSDSISEACERVRSDYDARKLAWLFEV